LAEEGKGQRRWFQIKKKGFSEHTEEVPDSLKVGVRKSRWFVVVRG